MFRARFDLRPRADAAWLYFSGDFLLCRRFLLPRWFLFCRGLLAGRAAARTAIDDALDLFNLGVQVLDSCNQFPGLRFVRTIRRCEG
jgi:hypothetical protein